MKKIFVTMALTIAAATVSAQSVNYFVSSSQRIWILSSSMLLMARHFSTLPTTI